MIYLELTLNGKDSFTTDVFFKIHPDFYTERIWDSW